MAYACLFMDALPILNEPVKHVASNVSDKEAFEDIIQTLKRQSEKVTLLFTGPLTDLAKALQKDSSIVQYIEKLVWMGGTFLPKGNVEEPEHDGSAEWNAYWDPEAVKIVFDSDIEIDMVCFRKYESGTANVRC